MSDQIPPELLTRILCRLPVKTLLRFRCISKPWCFKIDNPDFIKLHLKHSTETKSELSVILSSDNQKLYSVDFDSLGKAVDMTHSFKLPSGFHSYNRVLGSCNGLLCIGNHVEDICLLNPSTKQLQMLPFMPGNYQRSFGKATIATWVYGFCYHPITDDYKVVQIAQYSQLTAEDDVGPESDIMVYSLNTNTWRKLPNVDMPFIHNIKNPGVMVGGALHWRMSEATNDVITQIIVAFDLGTQDLRKVPPPHECLYTQIEVWILEGCLTVLATHVDFRADLWVMKQYGVKESWTKLFSVASPGLPTFPQSLLPFVEVVKPLAYAKNGAQVLLQNKMESLVWYDLETTSIKDNHIQGMPNTFDAFTCVASLVPLNVHKGTHGKKQQAQEEKKNIKKKRDDFLSKGFKLVL